MSLLVHPTRGRADASGPNGVYLHYDQAIRAASLLPQAQRIVVLAKGTHLSSALAGQAGLAVTTPGALDGLIVQGEEGAVVSAGVRLDRWESYANGWWICPVPVAGLWPRSLRVGEKSRPVARLGDGTRPDGWIEADFGRFPVPPSPPDGADAATVAAIYAAWYAAHDGSRWFAMPGDLPQTLLYGSAVLSYMRGFSGGLAVITGRDDALTLRVARPDVSSGLDLDLGAVRYCQEAYYEILNDPCGMTQPGSWYYDAGLRAVVYRPVAGERMETMVAWAAHRPCAIQIDNSAATVASLRVCDGNDATWDGGSSGIGHAGAALRLRGAGVAVSAVRVHACGGDGIDLGRYAPYLPRQAVRECVVEDVAGVGVLMSGDGGLLYRSRVSRVGLWDSGSVGAIVGGSEGAVVRECVFEDAPGHGLQANWCVPGATVPTTSPHRIEGNLFEGCASRSLDIGAIYVAGGSPWSNFQISYNVVRDTPNPGLARDGGGHGSGNLARWAIYVDTGTVGTVLGNVVDGCSLSILANTRGGDQVLDNRVRFDGPYLCALMVGGVQVNGGPTPADGSLGPGAPDEDGTTAMGNVWSCPSGQVAVRNADLLATLSANVLFGASTLVFGGTQYGDYAAAKASAALGQKLGSNSLADPGMSDLSAVRSLVPPSASSADLVVPSGGVVTLNATAQAVVNS